MGVEAVIATQVIDTTSVGRSLMTAADAAAARTALNLGTLATQSGTFSGTSSGTNTGDQNIFSTIAVSGQSNVVADQASDTLTIVAGTNITITTDASTDTITIAASGGGLSGTGSVDNAALRADGTGGSSLQNSAWIINDNLTASPNNTVNHACLEATGGTTNVSVSVKPKGTGSFSLAAPDGTTTGGNSRGANAVDLQTYRTANTQVASGSYSACIGAAITNSGVASVAAGWAHSITADYCFAGGKSVVASALSAVGIGDSLTVSGQYSAAFGGTAHTASGTRSSVLGGYQNIASGVDSCVIGGQSCTASTQSALASGISAVADRYGMMARSAGVFAANGDIQIVEFQSRNKTTSAVATELFLNGSSTRLTIPSGKMLSALVRIVGIKSDGLETIKFLRDVTIKNVGGTTSLETSPVTIGTDINVSSATLDLSADNTNDALKIAVTPPAGTWRWMAVVQGLEIAYGT